MDIEELRVLNAASNKLPFNSSSKIGEVGQEARLEYRPLAARNNEIGNVFRIQAAILKYFRAFLEHEHFLEIITSKIVASGSLSEGPLSLKSVISLTTSLSPIAASDEQECRLRAVVQVARVR
jgi:aspartyl/asparaginyl-tRNA synthetase